jgi:folate-binding protein YgfZ
MDVNELIYADRSSRGKLKVAGPQAAWFLDQILTQRFEGVAPGEAVETAMLTVHGRMTAYAECIFTPDGAILCHFEPELRPSFQDNLQRYVFATQVELADVTDDYGLVLLAGPGHEAVAAEIGAIVHPTAALGVPATYAWVERGALDDALSTAGGRRVEESELEEIRIANGVPRWGQDMDTKTFPQEVGIDARAVHFEKGCYLGQEAMAKIHFRGKVNRKLVRIESADELEPGAELSDAESSKAGIVTSVSGLNALAVVRHSVEPPALLHAGDVDAKVLA